MSSSANIHSLEALRELRAALIKYREEATNALVSVDVESRRAFDWLSVDELKRWQRELRRREDKVGECKTALARCQLMKLPSGETPSCDDEKKQLRRAQAMVEEAMEKVQLVKKWTQVIEQEMIEYRGPAQQLDTLLNSHLLAGIEDLDSRVRSIEAYLETVATPGEIGMTTAENTTEALDSAARVHTKPATDSPPPSS